MYGESDTVWWLEKELFKCCFVDFFTAGIKRQLDVPILGKSTS